MSNIRSCWDTNPVTHHLLLPCMPPAWGAETPVGDTVPRSHLRWFVCTPAAWARHRAGSPSSAGPTRSPGRGGFCWLSPSPAVPAGMSRWQGPSPAHPMPTAHLELVGFDVATAIGVVPAPSLWRDCREPRWGLVSPTPPDTCQCPHKPSLGVSPTTLKDTGP